ncbi:GDP/GTP exchange factor for ARF [Friedmanniomyces endolithicus]|uniref:GDP/GTP exchange factor for ARF n=1 Tax=Friedmanniomyces endolithicus TaxID=329885 RepID=A0AAN6JYE2_9PEZI|nr:GDP/GTP exchange factor for ARF [Friedmanniomyces endolithicus]KAK0954326.1 GDP/GTP exchange factor for ARF [Friedmanniomyces endolithicus]KAK0957710.1 GDP/GTP exchange factor for ARF [Friedmanniomyces endolithicus]KAK1044264.1 GDP/GTP exchange factor for ARF [Friedmanniomyces endolithicus]
MATDKDGCFESKEANTMNGTNLGGHGRPPSSVTVAIDPVALVVTECITVTSAMRKHARWAHSSISSILGASATPRPPPADARGTNHDRSRASSKIDLIEDDGTLTSRWGLRGKKGQSMQDNPLMSAFARLRADLKGCKDIQGFDTPSLLQPFLQVIRSSSTTAPITSLALIAITKMLAYKIINVKSPGFSQGMQLLASTVTNCRFEGDNSPSDEVVFLRILKLMEDMICGPSGDLLGDQSVCEMMTCALSICCHLRMGEVLRRSAEISMVTMCQTIFTRLKTLEMELGEEHDDLEKAVTQEDMDAARIDSNPEGDHGLAAMQHVKTSLEVPGISGQDRPSMDVGSGQLDVAKPPVEEVKEVRPYGLPSIRELFRVLADLLDPHDKQRTDTLRVMALRIVNVALEVAGPSISSHPSLASLAKDTLCRNLFQLVRSENIAILHESLRVAGTLLATCRNVLKLQQELFLSYVIACLHPRVPIPDEPTIDPSLYQGVPQAPALVKPLPAQGTNSGRNTPVPVKDRQRLGMEGGSRKPDAREAMVESVGGLVRIPSFMVELFVNYDCEIDRSDLCTDMVGLLSRNAFPDSATWSTTNVPPLCLDSLLGYVQFIAERLDDEPRTAGLPERQKLRERRDRKKVIIRGATKFNENPKGGIAFLAAQGIIEDPNDPHSVTSFLKGTTRIDKRVLGEFITKKGNEAILETFIDLYDFRGMRIDEALRQVLTTFRLPGESALIERIVTVLAEKYFSDAQPKEVADTDALFVLTYAIIMLNTDQYNPNVKSQNRMKVEDFAKNLRGVNSGKDFDREYLQAIYDAIKANEIVLPEEHDNKHAFDHAWRELLEKAQTAEDLVICETNLYDADMFAATWRPIIATLNYVFVSATEDAVFQRVIAGYNQCAQIAAKYGISECLDQIIESLAKISGLATEAPPDTGLNTEVQASGKSIMVSKFAVDFGRDPKAQLATLVLFRIIGGHEGAIRNGWTHIVRIIVNLFINSLIPTSFTSISRDLDLPPIPLQSPAQVIERNDKASDVGLFSAFTSYVSSVMNDEPPEPNDQEIEATLCAVDCINACHSEEILGNVSELRVESLKSLIMCLLSQLPEQDPPPYITVKTELPAPTPVRVNGSAKSAHLNMDPSPLYDPAMVYVLELATILALRDEETIAALGADVADALQAVIRDADRLHPVALSRTVFYLLALLRASNDHKYIRTPVVLHAISAFRQDVLRSCALPILKGIQGCISGPAELKNEMATSPDFWAVMHAMQPLPETAPLVFQIAEAIADGPNATITGDNYEATIALLNAFATAGNVGARQEQQRDQTQRRGQQAAPQERKPKKSDVIVRGTRALTIVAQLAGRVPSLIEQSHLETHEAWRAYWSPVFRCLVTQCVNPCREIRQQAFSSLQRCLLSSELASPDHTEWINIFGEVLFPLINQLLKPEVYQTDPAGMSETRVQAAQLLCKVFLHYLVLLSEWEGVLDLWVKIMGIMDRLMNSGMGAGDMLVEAVPESLKNILLVMASGNHLAPPPAAEDGSDERTEQQRELWSETWTRLERFLPGLMPELFPDVGKEAKPVRQAPDESATADQETAQVPSRPASALAEPQAA